MPQKLTKKERARLDARNSAKEHLLNVLKIRHDTKIYCVLRHVARSNMSREISLKVMGHLVQGEMHDITYAVAELLNLRIGKNNGVVVSGYGLDLGLHIVSQMSYSLWDGVDSVNRLKHEWL